MRKIGLFSIIGGLVLLWSDGAFGQVPGMDSLRISGWGAMNFGQIMHGYYGVEELDHKWQGFFQSQLSASAKVNARLDVGVGMEMFYQYSTVAAQTNGPSYLPGIGIILHRADMNYKLFTGNFPLSVQAGYFPFKYNAEARNLGEYLFRTGCYPNYITNNFDFPLNRLLGFNIDNTLLKDNPVFSVHQNLLLTSETEIFPFQDISLSWLAELSIWRKALKLGGGVCGHRLFSVDEKNTTPHHPKSIAEITNVRTMTDTVTGTTYTAGDTTFYTFAGTKLMAHATIDPKVFFPHRILGEEDLKLYGEVGVLGLKNYPVYQDSSIRYDILSERIPFMLGFNIPAFKVLDILSFEVECYNNRYYNSYYNQFVGAGVRLPLPYVQARGDQTGIDSSIAGNWKWSLYAKRSIGRNIQIIAQFACDHRHAIINLADPRYGDYGDNLSKPNKDWYYLIKLAYCF